MDILDQITTAKSTKMSSPSISNIKLNNNSNNISINKNIKNSSIRTGTKNVNSSINKSNVGDVKGSVVSKEYNNYKSSQNNASNNNRVSIFSSISSPICEKQKLLAQQHDRSASIVDQNKQNDYNYDNNRNNSVSRRNSNYSATSADKMQHTSHQQIRPTHFQISTSNHINITQARSRQLPSTFTIAQLTSQVYNTNNNEHSGTNNNINNANTNYRNINIINNNGRNNSSNRYNNNNISNKWGFNIQSASLGVIVSEDSCQDKQSSSNGSVNAVLSRRQVNISNINNNMSTYSKKMTPIQLQSLIESQKNFKVQCQTLKCKISLIQSQLQNRNRRICQLQQNVSELKQENSRNRIQLLQQQKQMHEKQKQKLATAHQQQMNRKQKYMQWENKNIKNMYNMEVQTLKGLINNYKNILQADQHAIKEHRDIQNVYNRQQNQYTKMKQQLQRKQNQIQRKQKDLQNKYKQFYKQSAQTDAKINDVNKQLQEQRIKIRKQRIKLNDQLQAKYQEKHCELDYKNREYQQKLRKVDRQLQQLELAKAVFQKQKQCHQKLHNKLMSEHKTNINKINQERQRSIKLQQQLYKRIQTVQNYANKSCSSMLRVNSANINKQSSNSPSLSIDQTQIKIYNQPNGNVDHTTSQQNKQQIDKQQQAKNSLMRVLSAPKIQLQNYINKVNKSVKQSKCKGRPIYKLYQQYI